MSSTTTRPGHPDMPAVLALRFFRIPEVPPTLGSLEGTKPMSNVMDVGDQTIFDTMSAAPGELALC